MVKKILFIFTFLVLALPLFASESLISKRGLFWYDTSSLPLFVEEEMKELFILSFHKMYRSCGALQDLSDQEIIDYLASDFEKILRPNIHSDLPQLFLAVKLGNDLVGYAFFEKIDDETMYIAELAVHPDFWGQGIGTEMTFAILEKDSRIRKLVLLTEKANTLACRFYESLGFQRSDYNHGYSLERYCAYELAITN